MNCINRVSNVTHVIRKLITSYIKVSMPLSEHMQLVYIHILL